MVEFHAVFILLSTCLSAGLIRLAWLTFPAPSIKAAYAVSISIAADWCDSHLLGAAESRVPFHLVSVGDLRAGNCAAMG